MARYFFRNKNAYTNWYNFYLPNSYNKIYIKYAVDKTPVSGLDEEPAGTCA